MNLPEERSRKKLMLGSDGNALVNLVVVIAVAFVLLKFVYVIYQLSDMDLAHYDPNVWNWLAFPASFEKFMTRPWTIITSMFIHREVMHLVANLLWLWMFGYILQDLTGNRKLVPIFLYGGWAGCIVFAAANYLIPRLQPGIDTSWFYGSNAAVMAVAIATTTVAPDYRIFPMINGGIPLWIISAIFVVVDFAGIGRGPASIYLAHLAGAAIGFIFIYQMRRGKDWSDWINQFFDWIDNLFNPDRPAKKKKSRDSFFYKVSGKAPFKKYPHVTQQRIDQILDKINQEGYHLLTDEEKDILRRAANEDDL
ncbi:rhomboid family intramembrane serine protease [Flavihumibacter petaseus]|uniref:Peptidase S54 family protein n=1 Tax=Flavihumibacter petaseus NBRC 106054 TaxID=1220578 RepID=A0A0E9MXA9_9BACT|nr:rhomboid family intramembrane serine protease [Flavihumibacter petaseus]GAO42046.1 peptidase S54 family protein [Flavihumibacter petaseus NBRC 106054]